MHGPAKTPLAVTVIALIAFAALAAGNLLTTSPTSDEPVHLAAGYMALRHRDHRMNPEHPPLLKKLAAAPLLAMDVWPSTGAGEGRAAHEAWVRAWREMFQWPHSQWRFSRVWLYGLRDSALGAAGQNPIGSDTTRRYARSDFVNDSEAMFDRARVPMVAIGILAGLITFLWSRELWGLWGGAVSALLFAFDPSFIAHSALVTTDVGAAALIIATVYFFWRFCRRPSLVGGIAFALAFALAQTAKFSALLLIPIIVPLALWQAVALRGRRGLATLGIVALAGLLSVALIWTAYDFRFSAAPARGFATGETGEDARTAKGWRKLLPEAYLHGIEVTARSSQGRRAFLHGEISENGFRSYFAWTFLYKTPIPALLVIGGGVVLALRAARRDLVFVAWPAVVLAAVAVTSNFNIGHRHILPLLPFVYVMSGALGEWLGRQRRAGAILIGGAALLALSANVVFAGRPALMSGNHLAYLNELAGGPRAGYEKLNDSNFDWGQDLERLAAWTERHAGDEPIGLVLFGAPDPRFYGIRHHDFSWSGPPAEPPRFLAISTAAHVGLHRGSEFWRPYLETMGARRVGRAGWSILIFRIE